MKDNQVLTYSKVALVIVQMTLPVGQRKEDEPIVWTPLHASQMGALQLLAKDAVAIH